MQDCRRCNIHLPTLSRTRVETSVLFSRRSRVFAGEDAPGRIKINHVTATLGAFPLQSRAGQLILGHFYLSP